METKDGKPSDPLKKCITEVGWVKEQNFNPEIFMAGEARKVLTGAVERHF